MAHSRTKQLLSVLAAIIVAGIAVIALCLFSVFSPHEHVIAYADGNEATCIESGEKPHWYCKVCKKNFEDDKASVEIATVYIPSLQHVFTGYDSDETYHYRQCVVCYEISQLSPMEHILKFHGSETEHARECYCGYEDMRGQHVSAVEGGPCQICGYGGLSYRLSLDRKSYTCTGASDASKDSVEEFTIPDKYEGLPVRGIDDLAFRDCVALKKVTFGANVLTLGERAFLNCTSLTEVKLNSQLRTIGASAFYNCTAIEELVLPQSLTNISAQAFKDCKNLKRINIPDKITKMERLVFSGCTSLSAVNLSSKITTIELGAFFEAGLTELTFPDKITEIPQTVCYQCRDLETVVIPASVKTIGTSAFMNCKNLKTIIFLGSEEQWKLIDFYIRDDGHPYPAWNAGVPEDLQIIFKN